MKIGKKGMGGKRGRFSYQLGFHSLTFDYLVGSLTNTELQGTCW